MEIVVVVVVVLGLQDMGGCCSCHVSIGRKVYDMESESDDNAYGDGKSSKFISMYSQKGRKGVNQDALTVWEVRFFIDVFADFFWFYFLLSFPLKFACFFG